VGKSESHLQSFSIFQDHSQLVTSNHNSTNIDVRSRTDDHEDMELHPAVTAVFRPENVNEKVTASLDMDDSMKGLPLQCLF
jgi:hypothetical protein